ncbi:hypothetical protein EJ05DRAFT_465021 [Pseudovirgaria hyperparasitica]|uniref:Uncharacterized protein n=1 Tax=Pseudovirgaria hyperparasitica TaxID=470096 RepID=A0A6A6W7A3_9PEZI|nr:uncharacterized protein EJ05DRAFT_465021 [Pseudovirgaria hyperparasitica]KAF2758079.1 hypothetical protein EJ05DRAFT_465021 [Pseudovirgaria hyperparasitica]
MGSTSVLSVIFFAVALLIIFGAVLLLIRYYVPLRSTPSYITVPAFLAIALPASIILLVPIDLASWAQEDDGDLKGIWLPERVILVSWRILYWLTFVLTWAILPLTGEYADSGYREPRKKLLYSLQSNGRYWLIMIGASTLAAVYYFLQNGLEYLSLKGTVMALAYAWGLILAIYLMGHGLVAMPRWLFRTASVSNRLRITQSHAPKVLDRLMDSLDEVDKYELQVQQLQSKRGAVSKTFQEWIDELSDGVSLLESRPTIARATTNVPVTVTERYLADLTRKLKRARHRKMRFVDEWDRLVRSAQNTQAILDSTSTQRLDFPAKDPHDPFFRLRFMTPYTRYILHVHIMPITYYALSALLSIAAVLVIWSSIVKSLSAELSVVGLSVVHKGNSSRMQISLAGQLTAAFWMLYMLASALYAVTEVKIWGNRALVRRGTYPESATWYACQLAKLSVPLAYNFITFLPRVVYRATWFHKFLGRLVVLTPLGAGFQDYFPMLILVPVVMTLFGVYGRVRNVFGFGAAMVDDEDGEAGVNSSWREGRALIDREIQAHGNADAVGLANRINTTPSSSASNARSRPADRYTDDPSALVHAATANSITTSTHTQRTRLERATRQARMAEEEQDAGGFFDDLGSRLRNTFDTMERPRWMMGSSSGAATCRRQQQEGSGLRRWFGGGGNEGRVRL